MTISPDCRNGCKDFDIVNLCAFRQIQRCRSPITDTPGSATPRRARVTATRPNAEGGVGTGAAIMTTPEEAAEHHIVTDAVHAAGGKIAMQILHTGRYAYNLNAVAPSALQAPINFVKPKELDEAGIQKQISDFVRAPPSRNPPVTTALKSWDQKDIY